MMNMLMTQLCSFLVRNRLIGDKGSVKVYQKMVNKGRAFLVDLENA